MKLKTFLHSNEDYASPVASKSETCLTGDQLNQYRKGKTRDEFGLPISPEQFIRRAELNMFKDIGTYISMTDKKPNLDKNGRPELTDKGKRLCRKDSRNKAIASFVRTVTIPTVVVPLAINKFYFGPRNYNKFLPTDLTHEVKVAARVELKDALDQKEDAVSANPQQALQQKSSSEILKDVADAYGVTPNAIGTWAYQANIPLPEDVYPRRRRMPVIAAGNQPSNPQSTAA